jgi:hypothetical protein
VAGTAFGIFFSSAKTKPMVMINVMTSATGKESRTPFKPKNRGRRIIKSRKMIRRSVASASDLVNEVQSLAPPELRDNFNRLVVTALTDFSKRQKMERLEMAMAEMASDPAIRKVCQVISQEFTETEDDGFLISPNKRPFIPP